MRGLTRTIAATAMAMLAVAPAQAQIDIAPDSGDSAWLLAAALLAFATALLGLVLFMGGRLPGRALASVAAPAVTLFAATTLFWAVLGYSLAYGPGSTWLGGFANLFLGGLADIREGTTLPESGYALFQLGFALFAVALLAGSAAGRARGGWLIAFVLLWLLLVHVPVARWLWGGGWLAGLGALDHAGGLVVQASAGISALVAAWMLGARDTAPAEGPQDPFPAFTGALLLPAGWLALAGGSALGAGDDAARAMLNALLAASAGALAWIAAERLRRGATSPVGPATGAIAGLSAVSAAAGYTGPAGAILIGLIAAPLCLGAAGLIRRRLGIDDTLGLFAIHGATGLVGALLLPVLMLPALGAPAFADVPSFMQQVVAQIVAVGVIALWSIIGTAIAGYMAAMVLPMRDAPAK